MKRIVIILPTYNERENIEQTIENVESVFKTLSSYKCMILVVDDNSPDGTGKIVEKLMNKFNNVDLITGSKKGLGAAYVRGMRYAINKMKADIFFEMDSDFSHDPKIIPNFVKKIEDGSDFVIGSRYIKGGSIPKQWGIKRKIYSVLGNLIVRFGLMLLRVKDWTSGYRAVKKEVFESVGNNLDQYKGYTFQVAFLHRAMQKGFDISEVPIQFIDRKYGQSKIIPTDYIKNVIVYIITNSSFIRFLIVGTVGFVIQTLVANTFINMFNLFPGVAVGIAAEAAIISNFVLNQLWTFSHKRIEGKKNLFAKFLGFNTVSLGAILIQSIAVTVGTHFFGRDSWFIVMVFAIIIFVIPYSYFIYHKVIWKDTSVTAS